MTTNTPTVTVAPTRNRWPSVATCGGYISAAKVHHKDDTRYQTQLAVARAEFQVTKYLDTPEAEDMTAADAAYIIGRLARIIQDNTGLTTEEISAAAQDADHKEVASW